MDYQAFLAKHRLDADYQRVAQKWFTPLGDAIASHHNGAKKPFLVGLNGAQGSGKSTLADFLHDYLTQQHRLSVVVLSLDDFYLNQSERMALSIKTHPLFKTRGVPGTHDTALIEKTLNRLGEYGTVSIPRFNKATDNPFAVIDWPIVNAPVDVVIFEGWCWGATPQSDKALQDSINELETEHDGLGVWRDYVNTKLQNEYTPLQQRMDYWVMLGAPDFECVLNWRIEQEHKLLDTLGETDAKSGIMDDSQIAYFIAHFERLTRHILSTLPETVDCYYQLDENRAITDAKASFL